jgi:hypothetical protein
MIRLSFSAPAALLLLVTACNGHAGQRADTPEPAREDSAVEISLERTACFGSCPIYRLTVDGTGLVRYEGVAYVDHVGVDSAHISAAEVSALVAEAERSGFFALADSYQQGDPTCQEYFPDSPSVIASITAGERQKRVVVDHGCTGFPQTLAALASRIDSVTGVARWTGQQ